MASPSTEHASPHRIPFEESSNFDRRKLPDMIASSYVRAANYTPLLTPTEAQLKLKQIRKRAAKGREPPGGAPSQFPGEPLLYVGTAEDAANLEQLKELKIEAVLDCGPSLSPEAGERFGREGVSYLAMETRKERDFPLLKQCLGTATEFIKRAHSGGHGVLIHCAKGFDQSAALAVAVLLIRDRKMLFDLFRDCVRARPGIVPNESFQLQLCELAVRNGLLHETKYSRTIGAAAPPPSPPPEAAAAGQRSATQPSAVEAESVSSTGLTAQPLTGNGEMAEDLTRVACTHCSRLFAPSVLARHAPICKKRAAKDAARDAKLDANAAAGGSPAKAAAQTGADDDTDASVVATFLEGVGLQKVHGLLEAMLAVAPNLQTLSKVDDAKFQEAIAPIGLKPKGIKYQNLMAAMDALRASRS